MGSLDYRTRLVGHVRSVEPERFFGEELPEALVANAPLVAEGARRLELPALALDVAGGSWTMAPTAEGLRVDRGSEMAPLVVELDEIAFSELIEEEKTALGLLFAGRARVVRGESDAFVAWDTLLRAALDGRAVFEPGSVALEGRERGELFALDRNFDLDDDPAEMRHFIEQAGYLHLRSVFTRREMERVSKEMDAAAAAAKPGDGGTWWVGSRARGQVPTRLLEFQESSETLRTLLSDPRFARLGAQLGLGHVPGDSFGERFGRISAEALLKPHDVVEGIADLPWHKDCARGGHSRHCCALTLGIAVTPASRECGRLHVIAGSHRINVPGSGLSRQVDLPNVPLDTETGDVTLHTSCTLHMSVPPTRAERRVVYCGFSLPPRAGDARGPFDDLRARRERARIHEHTRAALDAGARARDLTRN